MRLTDRKHLRQYAIYHKGNEPIIQGVVVAARGNITQTKIREISEAVQALFGIEAHKIKVIEKKSQAEEAK